MIVVLTGRGQRFHGAAVKESFAVMMRNFAGFLRLPYLRASLMIPSLASAPLLAKNPVHARYFSKLLPPWPGFPYKTSLTYA